MKWKTVSLTMFASMLMASTAFGALQLTIDGKPLTTDVPPTIVDGRTLVPVRAIFESLGTTIAWDEATQTVTATNDTTTIALVIDKDIAMVNGESKTLDVPAKIIDGRTMVPARFVAEALNCTVGWDADTQTVTITKTPTTEMPTTPEMKDATESQKKALEEATATLARFPYSYDGLVAQLQFAKISEADAKFAADNSGADWNAEALKKAKGYLEESNLSYSGVVSHLTKDLFTEEQAKYAADNCGADWKEQAVESAKQYISLNKLTKSALIEQLLYTGFTKEEADYAAKQVGL